MNRLHNRLTALESNADTDLTAAIRHLIESLSALDKGQPVPETPAGLSIETLRCAMVAILRQLDERDAA